MFVHSIGDAHLYLNHVEQAELQLSRIPKALPRLKILNSRSFINDFVFEDFAFEGYDPHPTIKADIAV
jgi:thymidylate synthase